MTTTSTMTSRERWLAALKGEPVDRLPFWPKLSGSYMPVQAEPFRSMTIPQLHDWIGGDPHDWVGAPAREVRRRTSLKTDKSNGTTRITFQTPIGTAERITQWDAPSQSSHPVSFPVKTPEDIKILTAYYEDEDWEFDPAALERIRQRVAAIGQTACIATTIGESPLMHWVEWLAGVENAHYLLADCPGEVEGLFEAMHRSLLKRAAILAQHALGDLIYMVENTSTTLISPAQYRKYCSRHIRDYAAVVNGAGRMFALHMCGTLKRLLPDLAQVGAAAFEAFTSPPVGDTRLADGRRDCPKVCLIGGTNATLWTYPAQRIIAELERDLAALPHHRRLVVTSAGVMPPLARPDTIREVCRWVQGYRVG